MKVALVSIMHEADTFSPIKTTLREFENRYILEGDRILPTFENTNTEIWGFVSAMAGLDKKVEPVPLIAASAVSGGTVTAETFQYLRERLSHHLNAAGRLEGVYMPMHGAMVAELPGGEDATGLFLKQVRESVGRDVPIIVTLDLHANVTEQMAENATAIIGYRTWPHIDQAERGAEAAGLLFRTLKGEVSPVSSLFKMPMILQVENGQTGKGPMAELLSRVRALEAEGNCLSGSVFLVQPWLDIPDTGCSVVVVTDGSREAGRVLAEKVGMEMWAKRHEFDMTLVPVQEAIRRAEKAPGRPVVLADPADGTGSGATGDSTAILKGLLDLKVSAQALLTVVDEEAVQAAFHAGQGQGLRIPLGGKRDTVNYSPVEVEARVDYVGEPSFRFSGPFQTGMVFQMGRVAVLRVRNIHILVSERPLITVDPEVYRAVGLEPNEAQIVVVKSPNLFRAAYEPIAHEIIVVDAPGLASPNIRTLPFKRLTRPCYPFDEDWKGSPGAG
ncbi:MAG TPA: M81 family metallopeptidase [Spirochaetia bacterium]|nr:M81 family metallopeptidase [Spirochaetia bacterium]